MSSTIPEAGESPQSHPVGAPRLFAASIGSHSDPRHSVLWVSSSFDTRGGITTFVRNIQQTDFWADWNVRHVSTHCNGSKFDRVAMFATGFLRFIAELVLHRPDVVHLHTSERGSMVRKSILAWCATLLRIPVVFHMHAPEFDLFYEDSPPPVRRLIRATFERAAAVISLGEVWASFYREIAPRARVEVIPNGIVPKELVDQSDSDCVHVIFVGELCERKGVSVLLEAWAIAIANVPHGSARLTIVGAGEVDRAHQQVDALGISDTVTIRGWLDRPEVQQLLSDTHVLVLPSMKEGQPMVILEAMARGLCVVSTRTGGIPEMIGDADGVLVTPGSIDELADALGEVISDYDLRRSLGEHAHERAETEFSLDEVTHRMANLYRSLV